MTADAVHKQYVAVDRRYCLGRTSPIPEPPIRPVGNCGRNVERICYMLRRAKAKYPSSKRNTDADTCLRVFRIEIVRSLQREGERERAGICICIYEIKHKVRRRSSSAAHLAHMTAACSKGSGGIFRKITKNQLNRAGGSKQRGAGVGRLTNHTHATTDTLFKSAGKREIFLHISS